MPAPTVTIVSPSIGAIFGGTAVTLTGTNFTGTPSVTMGGVEATEVVVVSPTTLTCVAPAHAAGVASVLVTTGSGTNGANSLFFYIPAEPADTYIYLKGGRGDGFVPQWNGSLTEEAGSEQSEPYRNEFQSSLSAQNGGASFATGFGGQLSVPAHLSSMNVTTTIFNGPGTVTLTPVYGALSDSLADAMSDPEDEGSARPPRQFTKRVTWLTFTSASGLNYKFRKADVIGWGSKRRDD